MFYDMLYTMISSQVSLTSALLIIPCILHSMLDNLIQAGLTSASLNIRNVLYEMVCSMQYIVCYISMLYSMLFIPMLHNIFYNTVIQHAI